MNQAITCDPFIENLAMFPLRYFLPLILASSAFGEELNVEKKPFFILHTFPAKILPAESTAIQLKPEEWAQFEIVKIKEHASVVKAGEPLLTFESEEIDRQISDLSEHLSTKKLHLQEAELTLSNLEKTNPEQLSRLKRSADQAAEELEYFNKTSRKSAEESAAFSLKQKKQRLASVQEELKQLLQMYEADDITEETEEIILQQQRDKVEYAEFALRMEKLTHKRTLEITIPNRKILLTQARDDSALALTNAQEQLPRSLQLKKIEVAKLKTELARAKESLEKLKQDRKLFEIKAPTDGTFYLGSIENGKWTTGELVKNLKIGGNPPLGTAFATFIPDSSQLEAQVFLDQTTTLALSTGASGTASLTGSPEITFPVRLQSIASSPAMDQKYQAVFEITWPNGMKGSTGQTIEIRIISYSTESALTVPTNALNYGPKGWTIEVKLADGKTEQRPVTRGKSSAKETEITSGLEDGQVVILP